MALCAPFLAICAPSLRALLATRAPLHVSLQTTEIPEAVGISKPIITTLLGYSITLGCFLERSDTAGATGFQYLVSPTIAELCRDTIDGKLDPTQHLLVDAARSMLLQELDLDVVQRIQVREPVAYRAIEQRIILQKLSNALTL
jgi:hypothetical protein